MAIIDLILGAAGIILAIMLAILIFQIVCMWKVYVKMGEPGWASIVPVYSWWVLCERTWGTPWMFLFMIAPTVVAWFTEGLPFVIVSIISAVVSVVTYWKMYKGFGKSTLFCILGIFFTPITTAICAFDSSDYEL